MCSLPFFFFFFLRKIVVGFSPFSWVCIFNLNDSAAALGNFCSKPAWAGSLLSQRNGYFSPVPFSILCAVSPHSQMSRVINCSLTFLMLFRREG